MESALQALVPECSPAVKALHTAWQAIGLSADAQAKLTKEIVSKMGAIFHEYVQSAEQERARLQTQVDALRSDNAVLTRRLGEGGDPAASGGAATLAASMPLQASIDSLKALNRVLAEKVRVRMHTLEQLTAQYETLFVQLNDQPAPRLPGMEEQAATLALIGQLEMTVSQLAAEKKRRTAQADSTTKAIVDLWAELNITAQTDFELCILRSDTAKLITLEQLKRLELKLIQLNDHKRVSQERKQALQAQITTLWDRLNVSADARTAFQTKATGLSVQALQYCADELERMKELKKRHLAQFIQGCRQELNSLWDQLYYSAEQRAQFIPATVDVYTEEALSAHEREVAAVKDKLHEWQGMLDMINEYKHKMAELAEFEKQSKDPDRLTSRSAKRDPGRLLREERFRKVMSKEIPKLEETLLGKLLLWEQQHGSPFTIDGHPYILTLKVAIAERKNAETRSTTPHKARPVLTPSKPSNSSMMLSTPTKTPVRSATLPVQLSEPQQQQQPASPTKKQRTSF